MKKLKSEASFQREYKQVPCCSADHITLYIWVTRSTNKQTNKVRGLKMLINLQLHEHRAPFGCEMMSCTSSELLCMTSAASLKVTPSRLILFREIRRPPADKGHSGILLASKKQMSDNLTWTSELRHNRKLFYTCVRISCKIQLNKTSEANNKRVITIPYLPGCGRPCQQVHLAL